MPKRTQVAPSHWRLIDRCPELKESGMEPRVELTCPNCGLEQTLFAPVMEGPPATIAEDGSVDPVRACAWGCGWSPAITLVGWDEGPMATRPKTNSHAPGAPASAPERGSSGTEETASAGAN